MFISEVVILIGVLADTHLGSLAAGATLLQRLCDSYFADAEMILHAGDLLDPALLHLFAPRVVHAVRGNLDPPGLPLKQIVTVAGRRIGLIHGWGSVAGLETRVQREFSGERLDCLVFGHSHQPLCRFEDGMLLFNPGSPTDRRSAPFHSLGLLQIDDGVHGRIIALPQPERDARGYYA